MADDFKVTLTCSVCNGTGMRPVWQGTLDEEGNFIPPGYQHCPECEDGKRVVGIVTIPQLNDIVDKVNDIKEKVNDIKEKVDEIKGVVDNL